MTIDEAIEQLNHLINNNDFSCEECKQEHIQLLNWLIELKEYKECENNGWKKLSNLFSPITEELIYKLCSVADENNYDRDSFIEAFAKLFKVVSETSTFKKYNL